MESPLRRRRSLHLPGYDYSQVGMYFITAVTHGRQLLFGRIVDEEMRLSQQGEIVCEEWKRISVVRPGVETADFVVMPNHIHGILFFYENGAFAVGATRRRVPRSSAGVAPTKKLQAGLLGAIMTQFKSIVTKRIKLLPGGSGIPVWQRNYYEHIIRDQVDYERIVGYILENPANWSEDDDNPEKG